MTGIPSSLSCECRDWDDAQPGDTGWEPDADYSKYPAGRRTRCHSCDARIAPADTVVRVVRTKIPKTDVEIKLYGEDGEIPRAPKWLCEQCADIMFSLDELGFCVAGFEDMNQLLADYRADYGPGEKCA